METPEQQRRPTIGQFAIRLKQFGLDLSAVDLADILWLAQFIEPEAAVRSNTNSNETQKDKTTTTSKITKTSTTKEPTFDLFTDNLPPSQPSSELSSAQKDRSAEKTKGMPFPAPAAPALRTRLDLARSLKPLMRKVPSRSRFDLDEEETVTQIAETRVWMVIERPRPERWLDLDLVVEGSKTTVLWERAIAELQHLTEYHGAFRTVRTWRLEAQTGKVKLFPCWNTKPKNEKQQTSQRPRNPKEILDPSGRRLVLFVTDCTSALWRQGMVHETLWQWSEMQLVAIVQMLPERLWGRTALSDGHRVRSSSFCPGMTNARLEVHGLPALDYGDEWEMYDEKDEEEPPKPTDRRLLTLPIVTLDPNALRRWAQVVAGIGDLRIPGRTFELAFIRELAAESPSLRSPDSQTARQRVALFQATASQTAQKLAGLMAATPVSLPVIDLLRDEFLPEAQQAHVAEVLLSGLLRRCDTDDEETCHYEFFGDGSSEPSNRVRYLLLDGLPEEKAISVLDRLSQIISKKAGRSLSSFEAFLATFKDSEHDFGEAKLPFAQVGLNTLRRLGGDYAALAERYSPKETTNIKKIRYLGAIGAIYNAFDPFEPLLPGDPAYVECGEVRGDSNIKQDLGKKIVLADSATCQLYAGHRGLGKSTELLRLQKYLEDNNCFVIYFSADKEDIDSEDAQYTDILLACTRHLLQDLRDSNPDPILHWLRDRWKDLQELALTTVQLDGLSVEAAITTFAKITANLRAVPTQRAKIRKLVDPYTTTLLQALNEFIHEAQNQLPLGKTRLVIIADSLDRITPTIQEDGRTNYDHIFLDRSQQLKGLDCHVVYTVPISLLYSSRANDLYDIYGETTILPMIMVQEPNGSVYQEGLGKIKEIISQRIKKINPDVNLETEIFENKTILENLCLMSGGNVRQLMQLIQEAINNIDNLPITAKAAQRSITKFRDVYRRTIEESQWSILAEVAKSKELKNSDKYRALLFNRCLFEYVTLDEQGELKRWCDVHPLIKDIPKFKEIYQQN